MGEHTARNGPASGANTLRQRLGADTLRRLSEERRQASGRHFDAARTPELVRRLTQEQAARYGVDADDLDQELRVEATRSLFEGLEAHKRHKAQLLARTPPAQREALRHELGRADRERGYRAQRAIVRELHADRTGGKVQSFLEYVRRDRPAARRAPAPRPAARRPRRSSSSSRTSGADPGGEGDSDPEPAAIGLRRDPEYGLINAPLAAALRGSPKPARPSAAACPLTGERS